MVNYVVFKKTRSLRASIFNRLAMPLVLFYRKTFKKKKVAWGETRESLKRFDDGSLGKSISEFLYEKNFELTPMMESHDVFHVITGYGTEMYEETAMQFFLMGNGKKSKLIRLAALTGVIIFPEYWNLYQDSFKRGKNTRHFSSWDFRELLFVEVNAFRREIDLPERVL